MMNDRFDAQLREHLLSMTNDRPAEGQLAAVTRGVAGIAQRRALAARLTWNAGRIGPFPSWALRVGLVVALVAATAGLAILVGGGQPATGILPPTGVATDAPPTPIAPTPMPTATAMPSPVATHLIADPQCVQFENAGTYTARVGTLPVSLAVPATSSEPWSGNLNRFALQKAPCDAPGLPVIRAALVAHLYADACHWRTSSIDAPTAFDLVQELGRQTGHGTVGPIETMLGSFRATRFDFTVPEDFNTGPCDAPDEQVPSVTIFGDQVIARGGTVQVYVADVDGVTLVVTVSYLTGQPTTSDLAQIDQMLAALTIEL